MEKVPITRPMLTFGRRQVVYTSGIVCLVVNSIVKRCASESPYSRCVYVVIKLVHQPAVCAEVQISLLMLPHTHTARLLLLEGECVSV